MKTIKIIGTILIGLGAIGFIYAVVSGGIGWLVITGTVLMVVGILVNVLPEKK